MVRFDRRADDQAIGAQIRHELLADVDLQLHHARRGAAADDDVVHRKGFEDDAAVAQDAAFEHGAVLFFVVAGQHRCQHLCELARRNVGDEAEAAVVDAHHRCAVFRQLARDAQHRAVTTDHHREVALAPKLLRRARTEIEDAGALRRLALE
jgi:hypothetical protein